MHHPNPSTTTTETNSHVSPIPCGGAVTECREIGLDVVGEVLRNVRRELSGNELDRHIRSCGELMLMAYGRFEVSHDPADKGEAHRWRVLMEQAIRTRDERLGAQRHAAFEQGIGSAWFGSDEAQAMGKAA